MVLLAAQFSVAFYFIIFFNQCSNISRGMRRDVNVFVFKIEILWASYLRPELSESPINTKHAEY